MTVRQEKLQDGERVSKGKRLPWESLFWRLALMAAGGFLVVFGVPLWLIGSWYTLRGVTIVSNVILAFFGLDGAIPLLTGLSALLVSIALGVFYSLVEFGAFPHKRRLHVIARRVHWIAALLVVAIWLLLIGSDIGSTYIGVVDVPSNAWPIAKWVAETQVAASLWSLFLTCVPETMIICGVIILWRAPTLTDRT